MAFHVAPAPVTLTGELVELRPLDRSHVDGLVEAVTEGDLWKTAWYTSVPAPDGVAAEVDRRLGLVATGEMVPFTAFDAAGRVLGLTSYYDIVADVPGCTSDTPGTARPPTARVPTRNRSCCSSATPSRRSGSSGSG